MKSTAKLITELKKASVAVYTAADKPVADHLNSLLIQAADALTEALRASQTNERV